MDTHFLEDHKNFVKKESGTEKKNGILIFSFKDKEDEKKLEIYIKETGAGKGITWSTGNDKLVWNLSKWQKDIIKECIERFIEHMRPIHILTNSRPNLEQMILLIAIEDDNGGTIYNSIKSMDETTISFKANKKFIENLTKKMEYYQFDAEIWVKNEIYTIKQRG